MTTGIIFNIQRFSTEDGPGIRTTVFFKGCPLRCPWCSNPESQNTFPEVAHRDSLCNKCGKCIQACPQGAIALVEKGVRIYRAACDNCGICVPSCLPQALIMYGKSYSVEDVMDEVRKDALYYRNSGGGVTASGGEALMQADFVAELFEKCRLAGIHTTLDTTGFASHAALEKVLQHTDLLLYDLKIMDSESHASVLKQRQEPVLRNLNTLLEHETEVIIRVPLIPTLTGTEANLKAIAAYVNRIKPGITVETLPYHRFGTGKYDMLDRTYELGSLTPQTNEQLESARQIFAGLGLNC